jgi:hypothetical protein
MEIQSAMEVLNAFDSPLGIAEFFRLQGVKGYIGDPNSCPISTWLREKTGLVEIYTEDDVSVPTFGYGHPDYDNEDFDHYPLSEAAKEFVYNFDEGDYPILVAEEQDWY